MKIVYIAGPFRDDPEGNKVKFEAVALDLWQKGFFVFNPIANTYFMKGKFTEDEFARRDIQAIRQLHFDAMLMLEGWECSLGARQERQAAIDVGIRVFLSVEDLCKWCDSSIAFESPIGENS